MISKDARDRLERVIHLIQEEPKRINMGTWNADVGGMESSVKPACNTAGCIAGWIVADEIRQNRLIDGLSEFGEISLLGDMDESIPGIACDLLGIEPEGDFGYPLLFFVDHWPIQFRDTDNIGDSWALRGSPRPHTPEYAAVVVERIQYFLDTGE